MKNNLGNSISWLVLSAIGLSIMGCSGGSPSSAPVATATPTPDATTNAVKAGGAATRRNVKTAIDPDAGKINLTAQDTTVEDIAAQKVPKDTKLEGRVAPFETSTWRVKATLASVKLMKDHDFYLVLKGEKGGETVVEVPDPNDCKGSPLEPQIAAARKELEDRYHPTTELKELHDHATVTGVGFLGFGAATKPTNKSPDQTSSQKPSKGRSGPRLMPGLGFDFGDKS